MADKGLKSKKERIRRYRRYVYEAGALNRPDKMQAQVIEAKVIAKERKKDFEISRISRFRRLFCLIHFDVLLYRL